MSNKKEPLGQIRIYKKDRGIIRRLAVRMSRGRDSIVSNADVIRQLIKDA